MDAATIISLIEALLSASTQIVSLISEVKEAVSSNDPAAIQAALTKIQAANDALAAQP